MAVLDLLGHHVVLDVLGGPEMTHVVGFHVQCAICPQRAFVDDQPEGDWVCPRCSAVAGGFGDVDVAQAEPYQPAGLAFTTEKDPLAQAIMAEIQAVGPAAKVTAQVGDRVFVLDSYTETADGLPAAGWYDRAELVKRCTLPRCPVCQKVVGGASLNGSGGVGHHTEDGSPVCRKPVDGFLNTVPPTPITFFPEPSEHDAVGEFDLVEEIGEFGVLCLCRTIFWADSQQAAYGQHFAHAHPTPQTDLDDDYPIGQVQG